MAKPDPSTASTGSASSSGLDALTRLLTSLDPVTITKRAAAGVLWTHKLDAVYAGKNRIAVFHAADFFDGKCHAIDVINARLAAQAHNALPTLVRMVEAVQTKHKHHLDYPMSHGFAGTPLIELWTKLNAIAKEVLGE